jgi:Kef-type K+ transport system membrane component KefB/mannitol/fructose-specific phosphotransferase system IIA component (Ntr-type)
MGSLSAHEITLFFAAVGLLVLVARVLGEVAVRLRQPAVVGEILTGVLLGPTVLGRLAPGWQAALFPEAGDFPAALGGVTTLGSALFLLVAGIEVDLSSLWRQGKAALWVGTGGMLVPFGLGFLLAWTYGEWLGPGEHGSRLLLALFFGTALSISALPVIAKMLMDLRIYRSDLGMIIVGAAVLNDLAGWIVFAVVLGTLEASGAAPEGGARFALGATILLTLAFALAVLTVGRWAIQRGLPWLQAHVRSSSGALGMLLALGALCAAFTEWIGLHAIFGAFLFGVALGDSRHLREHTRGILQQFVASIFAPLFFASIGLRVDFAANFDLVLVAVVVAIASLGKLGGCTLAARAAGLRPHEAWAVGFGLNARGAMEIVLGLLAREAGLISEPLFVALVVMAIVTSMTGGTLLRWILRKNASWRLSDVITTRRVVLRLAATSPKEAIRELARVAASGTALVPDEIGLQVWKRELLLSTGLEHGLAIPHARLDGIAAPIVAVGVSETGLDFNSFDGHMARVVFLILTPESEHQAQLDLLADIARIFANPARVDRAVLCESPEALVALVRAAG